MVVDFTRILSYLSNQHLGLILMPTEKCNFRCTYCYEDFLIGKMAPSTILGIKNLLKNRIGELKSLSVEWFGGEPLSAKNIIYDIGAYIQSLLQEYSDVRYQSGMTTNGYNLKGETISKLLDLKINGFQISLDGPRDIHNTTRRRINGEGSFDVIWENLLALRNTEQNFRVILRIHVTPDNYDKLTPLLIDIEKEFLSDPRFKLFFKAIENLGGKNSGNFRTLGQKKKAIIDSLNLKYNNKLISSSDEPYVCYASKANNLVIRANGTIAKCTVVFDDDRNKLGKINEDGTLEICSEKFNLWIRGIKTLDENTLQCPLHGLPTLSTAKKVIPISVVNG